VTAVRAIAGIAVVAIFCPLSTGTLIFWFVGSIAAFLICQLILNTLDEGHIDKYVKDGYWPAKPTDWHPLPDENTDNGKPTDSR
jgi:hypothetical protein